MGGVTKHSSPTPPSGRSGPGSPTPRPRPRRRPHPSRQRQRTQAVPVPRVRHQRRLAHHRHDRRRPAGLATATRPTRELEGLRTESAALPVPASQPASPEEPDAVTCGYRKPGPWVTDALTTFDNVMAIPSPTWTPGDPSLTTHQQPRRPAPQRHAEFEPAPKPPRDSQITPASSSCQRRAVMKDGG